ncbi:DUF2059 domain-containing protein [Opitutaceae bacterium]|nr:DUF2059 domain-containing protein [Opitutaceae bacterium]
MKFCFRFFFLILIGFGPSSVHLTAQPSDESVKRLLALSGSHQMVDMTKAQLSGVVSGPIQQAMQGHSMTPEITGIIQSASAKAQELLNEQLTWEKVEPLFVSVYQSTMTQDEVDGIIKFYQTPAGKAMVEKMPQLMQLSGQRLQQQLGPIAQKLQELQKETLLQLQVEFTKEL